MSTSTKDIPTFRFNFSNHFIQELGYFAKLHNHEDRHDFKENWEEWIENNTEMVDFEKERLANLGYVGDIEDKMYESARYYFRKKTNNREETTRCTRITVRKQLLDKMDQHIFSCNFNEKYTPQIAYEEFCKENTELIQDEFNYLDEMQVDNFENNFENKIKKTYKTRFYVNVRKRIQTNK